jgi:uncharacterized protein (UPF0332 family)
MSFDWLEYFEIARELGQRPQEAAKRTAVSRAYYSAYQLASASLRHNNVRTYPRDERKSHLKIWNAYTQSTKIPCRKIGNEGLKLKEERRDADYDADSTFNDRRVEQCISKAGTILASISNNVPEGYTGTRAPALTSFRSWMRTQWVKIKGKGK